MVRNYGINKTVVIVIFINVKNIKFKPNLALFLLLFYGLLRKIVVLMFTN